MPTSPMQKDKVVGNSKPHIRQTKSTKIPIPHFPFHFPQTCSPFFFTSVPPLPYTLFLHLTSLSLYYY